MIRKLVRQMLTAQIFSALTVSICLLIDNIMIARFLGVQAMAAYGFANPILLAIGAVGSLMTAGVQVVCSKSLGMGSQEETNAGYSTALAITAAVSLFFLVTVGLLRHPMATALGATENPELHRETADYLIGFTIGAPGSIGALVLVPFLQMAGQTGLLIAAVGAMTVADVVFDLLSVLVFHGGMFGMGLASSLSYYVALILAGFYFLNPKCVFRFDLKKVSWKKTVELLKGGVPTVFTMASTIVLVYILNTLLSHLDGKEAVAAYTLVLSLGNASNCISTGMGGVSLTMNGILFHEEDRTGLRELFGLLKRYAVIIGVCASALLILIAPWAVDLFLDVEKEKHTYDMAVTGVRLFALGLTPCCLLSGLKNAYQATGRVRLTEVCSVAEGLVFPAICAVALSAALGVTGVWFYFLGGELLTLLLACFCVCRRVKRFTLNPDDYLLLPKDFGVPPEDLLEMEIRNMEDVGAATRLATAFCLEHGLNERMTNRIALCLEEMAANTVTHGFSKAQKPAHLSFRLQHKGDSWTLRFRDDCKAFDPVRYVPNENMESGIGIRILLGMANEVRYTYSMNLNNLTTVLVNENEDREKHTGLDRRKARRQQKPDSENQSE